jgi:hypothetical protein
MGNFEPFFRFQAGSIEVSILAYFFFLLRQFLYIAPGITEVRTLNSSCLSPYMLEIYRHPAACVAEGAVQQTSR